MTRQSVRGAPALCGSCGHLFESMLGGGLLIGNRQTCPRCGQYARIADGEFQQIGGEIHMISGSHQDRANLNRLKKLRNVAVKAKSEKIAAHEILAEVADIDPDLARRIAKIGNKRAWLIIALLFFFVRSCELNVSLDLNKAVEQFENWGPETTEQQLETEGTLPQELTSESRWTRGEGPEESKESRQVRRRREFLARKRSKRAERKA